MPPASLGGDGDHRRVGETGLRQQFFHLKLDQFDPFGIVNQVDFAQNDDDILNVEQLQDGEVFAGLRHDAFVGGDDEQGGVDPADASQHILYEVAMARHIDNADGFAIWQVEPGEAQVNRHLAALLFGKPVRVDAAQLFDQRGFAVVDMTGCPDNAHGLGAAQSVDAGAVVAPGAVGILSHIKFVQQSLIAFSI